MSARILVVDDIAANVRLLEAKLLVEYYEVLTASDGESALEAARTQAPDLILLDVMMPGMDGYEVCRRLKADQSTMHIPVIMVTALSEVSERVQGLEAGADDFLTKPVNDTALFARIRSLVRLKRAHDEWRTREATFVRFGTPDGDGGAGRENAPGRILLLMDSDDKPAALIESLAACGHDVAHVGSLEDLPARLVEAECDLLLVNDSRNGRDALRLCSALRSAEATRHIPILFMIYEGDEKRLAKAFEIGINDYLVKPVNRDELIARTRSQIRRKRYESELRTNYHRSLTAAVTDSLTGLNNRRYLAAHFETVEHMLAESGKSISLMMLDIDHFKLINDRFGHAAGDMVLQGVAGRIMNTLRGVDTAIRFGGEEFVVLMPSTSSAEALVAAERLRREIARAPFAISGEETTLPVTVSIGLVTEQAGAAPLDQLVLRADQALYRAKDEGRDRVAVASTTAAPPASTPARQAVG